MSYYLNSHHDCKNVQQCFTEKRILLPLLSQTISLPHLYSAHWNFNSSEHPKIKKRKPTACANVTATCRAVSYLTCHVTMG